MTAYTQLLGRMEKSRKDKNYTVEQAKRDLQQLVVLKAEMEKIERAHEASLEEAQQGQQQVSTLQESIKTEREQLTLAMKTIDVLRHTLEEITSAAEAKAKADADAATEKEGTAIAEARAEAAAATPIVMDELGGLQPNGALQLQEDLQLPEYSADVTDAAKEVARKVVEGEWTTEDWASHAMEALQSFAKVLEGTKPAFEGKLSLEASPEETLQAFTAMMNEVSERRSVKQIALDSLSQLERAAFATESCEDIDFKEDCEQQKSRCVWEPPNNCVPRKTDTQSVTGTRITVVY